MGRKTTTITRKMPSPSNRTVVQHYLLQGIVDLEQPENRVYVRQKSSMKTIIAEPIIGPSMVPRPPITDIIKWLKRIVCSKN